MAIRYTIEALSQLRESPLCTKPTNLPPAEEWMGPPTDNLRNTQGTKPAHDRTKTNDGALLDQGGRRSHVSRTSEDLILGPPRNTFQSASFLRGTTDKIVTKDGEIRGDQRFPFRTRNGEASESNDRFRSTRDRDGRATLRPRGDTDQDSDGWVPVKPRKSFGHEGAERFHGRMGDRSDRFGGDRRLRDDEDRDNTERPRRNFGEFGRDKDTDNSDRPRRNGLNRNRPDQPAWARETTPQNNEGAAPRGFDRGKSWRDRAPADSQSYDHHHEKPRWGDRDHRQEHAPEWMDEPAAPEEKAQAPTMDDMKRFMESMKANKSSSQTEPTASLAMEEEPIKTASNSTPTVELNRDKYFVAYGPSPVASDASAAGKPAEPAKESSVAAPKPKSGSRFQNFFSAQQEESRRLVDSPGPATSALPPPPQPMKEPDQNPLLAALGGAQGGAKPDEEKVAFQALLSKLKGQTSQASTPPSVGFSEPPPSHEFGSKSNVGSPAAFSPYAQERREDPLARFMPPQPQEQHITRPQQTPNNEPMRPEQQLYDLLGQRHAAPVHPAQAIRAEAPSRSNNNNAEFLMTLMQSSRQHQPSMPMPPSRSSHIPQTPEHDLENQQRERSASQHQNRRPVGLPAFFDEPVPQPRGQDSRPQQPTQILQRQAPPGLDQMPPPSWMQNPGQQQPPPGRPMMPPPGLAGNPRNAPVPGMFPPNFPMGAFPPPEGMPGPPRGMAPPPGFYGGPPGAPPGFLPPPGIAGFQGPDAMGFGFDGRGMPPPGPGGPFPRRS